MPSLVGLDGTVTGPAPWPAGIFLLVKLLLGVLGTVLFFFFLCNVLYNKQTFNKKILII